jgi:DNA-binding SARP family transcriptional activator
MINYAEVKQSNFYSDIKTRPVMICLMGEFRLLVAGNLIQLPAGGKMETLLSYLALQSKRRVGRERLLQALWPCNDQAHGLNSLNTLVYNLHKLLGLTLYAIPLVLHEEGYYLLNPHLEIRVDVRCFDELLATADHKLAVGDIAGAFKYYQRAAELYRDDLCIATDVQALIERERLRTRYLTLLVQLANNCYLAGNYNTSLEYLWKLLGHDPYREDAHRLVMQCYVRRGERASALHQYQVCVDLLQSEFKALPEAATLALFEQICTDTGSI